jgi:hypothetical protein
MVWSSNPGRVKRPSSVQNVQIGCGCWGSLVRMKQPGLEADFSSPSNTFVNNVWSYISRPPVCLHGADRDGVKPCTVVLIPFDNLTYLVLPDYKFPA